MARKKSVVRFLAPVEAPIKAYYGDKGRQYDWSVDPDNGFWLPIKAADGFGQHRGTDFECPPGTVVRAMADGVVVRSRFESPLNVKEGAGLYILQLVMLIGFDSWVIKYSHLKASHVTPGQRIQRGDAIAESGNSGNVLSPYLHVDLMNLRHQWQPIPFDV